MIHAASSSGGANDGKRSSMHIGIHLFNTRVNDTPVSVTGRELVPARARAVDVVSLIIFFKK